MRRLLLGSAALTALTAGSFAADPPACGPAAAPAPVYVAPIFTWSGFYVGLIAGMSSNSNGNKRDDFAIASRLRDNDDSGFTGGAQIGHNWEFGSVVAGI